MGRNIATRTGTALTRRVLLASLVAAAAAAEIPAAAAAAPPPTYVVFFHRAPSELTSAALTVIGHAAARAKRLAKEGRLSHIKAIGYSDTVGSDADAERMSEQRAEAVRAALIADGIPGDQITTEGRGKKELAVQTRDQVRELRNRRVRIILYPPGS